MKSVVETLNPTRVKLVVEVPFAELKPSLDSAYRKIAQQVVVPGFRKGKVPNVIIDRRIGRAVVLEEAVNEAVPKFYSEAVQANEIEPLSSPEVDLEELADGADLKFTAEVDVRPKIELPEWEGINVEVADADPSDEDVDRMLKALQGRFGTLIAVDRQAADGDFVTIDLSATKDGEPIEGAQATGMSYQVGSGEMIDGLDEALVGMSEGDSKTFETTLLGDQEGTESEVTVTVQGVKEQELPDLDDDFAQMASEFDTVEELREDVRERAARSKRLEQASEAQEKLLTALLEMVEVPLPDALIEKQLQEHFEDGHGDDEHRSEYEKDLRRTWKMQFVLDELVKAEQVSVSQDELTNYIFQTAMRHGLDPNEYAQQAARSGAVPALVAEVARNKALGLVLERANVVDASGRSVSITELRADGTTSTPQTFATGEEEKGEYGEGADTADTAATGDAETEEGTALPEVADDETREES